MNILQKLFPLIKLRHKNETGIDKIKYAMIDALE